MTKIDGGLIGEPTEAFDFAEILEAVRAAATPEEQASANEAISAVTSTLRTNRRVAQRTVVRDVASKGRRAGTRLGAAFVVTVLTASTSLAISGRLPDEARDAAAGLLALAGLPTSAPRFGAAPATAPHTTAEPFGPADDDGPVWTPQLLLGGIAGSVYPTQEAPAHNGITPTPPDSDPLPDVDPVPDADPVPEADPVQDTDPVQDVDPVPDHAPVPDDDPMPDVDPVPDADPVPDIDPVPDYGTPGSDEKPGNGPPPFDGPKPGNGPPPHAGTKPGTGLTGYDQEPGNGPPPHAGPKPGTGLTGYDQEPGNGPPPHAGPNQDASPAPEESPAPETDAATDAGPAPEDGPAPEADPAPEPGPAPEADPAPDAGPAPDEAIS
jgi:hypothetical protein